MKKRAWVSRGIDVSADCVEFAVKSGLEVARGDYLNAEFDSEFDMITLWASIEHLHHPDRFLEKINRDLSPDGMLYISTCRTGGMNFMKLFGAKWRFYNFPEHLYFFSRSSLCRLLKQYGFKVEKYRTYGSGTGEPGTLKRRISDFMAKRMYMGDMMIVSARKV